MATEAAGTVVAVVGCSNAVGRALLDRLDGDAQVAGVLGVDLAPPDVPSPKLRFRTADVRDRLLGVALDGADVVVHCAVAPEAGEGDDAMFARQVHGVRNLLDAVDKAGARKLVVVSSAAVYGAHPDVDVPLREDAPLRANPDFPYAHQRLLAEEAVLEWAEAHPDVVVTVLRPALVLGPGVGSFVARALEAPVVFGVRGARSTWQVVHVDDLAAALHLVVGRDLPGAYNVAADGWLTADDVAGLLGRPRWDVPEATAAALLRRLWRWGLAPVPPGALHYVMHPWVVDASALAAEGWAPAHGQREVLRAFAAESGRYVALGRFRTTWAALAGAATAGTVGLPAALWALGRLLRRRRAARRA